MELVCPLCNSLFDYEINCEKCGRLMKDKGRITDFYDDYSPYLEMSITELIDGVPNNQCVHLFLCENCNEDTRVAIDKINK